MNMKNRLAYLFLGVFGLVGLASCESQLEDVPSVKTRTVFFSSVEKDAVTRTGITIENKVVTPDWRKTKAANVHLFETGNDGGVSTGEDVEITVASDNLTANFKADFPADMTIIVPPTDPSEGGGTKSVSNAPYTYSAVVAQKSGESFIVPSVQYPDAETLIDPDADFLIGYSKKSYGDPHYYEDNVVDLYFDRPVALSRITVTNFEAGEKVKSVTIKAQSGLTGSAAYNAIDFENANVTFTPGTESGTIELSYGNGIDIKTDGTFEAYFVSLPGTVTITELAVATDKYNYVKTIEVGKEFTLTTTSLKPIKFDLTTATKEEAVPTKTYVKVTSTEDLELGTQYLLVYEEGSKVFKPVLSTTSTNASFTVTSENVLGVTISNGRISSLELESCEMTLEAGYHFYVASAERYLYPTNSNYDAGCIAAEEEKTSSHEFSIAISSDGIATISRTSNDKTYNLCYDEYFRGSSDVSANVVLYKLDDGRLPQTPSFSPNEVNYDMAGSAALVKPTLSNAIGTAIYSSSAESIATVAPSTGDVTVKKKGTVEITASAAGNSQYRPGSASYTLVITNSSSTTPVWYKAEEIEDGETYLVVSHGYILKNDGSTGGVAIDLGATGDSFEYEADEAVIWTATESSGKFRLNNGGKVLRLSSSSFQIGTASGTESNNQCVLNDEALLMISSYYVYYSTSQSKWAVSNSASDSHTCYLYGLNPGRQKLELVFSETSVTYDIATGGSFTAPTLSGAQTDVTYTSSNAAVATVNATSGAVTIVGTGITVITASADGNDTFKPASATYTIHVIDGSVAPKTYVRVTSSSNLVVGAKYLLVYESTPSVFKPILDGSTFKKHKDNVQSVTISNHSITSSELADCELTLTEGYYLYVASADRYVYPLFDGNQTTTLEAESSPSHNLTVTINSDGTAKITNAASTASSFTWSTRSSYFSSTTSATATINVCLYKEDDGSNPGGGDDPTPTVKTTYYLASSIEAGKSYVIVSGGQALKNKRRHPTIEDNVTIYSGASILGGDTVIGKDVVIGGNAFITRSIPEGAKVSVKNQELRYNYDASKPVERVDVETEAAWFYII